MFPIFILPKTRRDKIKQNKHDMHSLVLSLIDVICIRICTVIKYEIVIIVC